jgi:hypothetical protein
MAKSKAAADVVAILQIVVGVFLITLGLIGIIHYNSDLAQFGRGMGKLFGRSGNPLNMIVAIVELGAGVIVFAGLFLAVKSKLLYSATLVIALLWIIQIVISFFAANFAEPDFIVWLNRLAADLVVLLSLWLINRKYA